MLFEFRHASIQHMFHLQWEWTEKKWEEKKHERERARGRIFLLQVFIHRTGEGGTQKYEGKNSWGALRVESGADMQVRSHFGFWADEFKRMCAGRLPTTRSLLLTTFCCSCCCAGAIDMANAPSLFASSLPARRLPRTFCATVSSPSQRPLPQRRASLGMVCVYTAASNPFSFRKKKILWPNF
jgi:hypothetical protein